MPCPLLVAAAMIPATLVPCHELLPSVQPSCRNFDVAASAAVT